MISEYLDKLQRKRNMGEMLQCCSMPVNKKNSSNDKEVCQAQARKGHWKDAPGTGFNSGLTHSSRGRIGYMQYSHGFIGWVLVVLALIHLPYPTPLAWLPYAGAAILAFITLKSELSLGLSRILAITTAATMFFFFAYFFLLVPKLEADWYTTQFGWAAVSRIVSAFVMIPILSDYSCRLKADCLEARAARRAAFFSVPSHIRPESR